MSRELLMKMLAYANNCFCCRLIPILILLYRYMMVCHSNYCLKIGEQKIRERLLNLCGMVPCLVALLSMVFAEDLRDNNICNGREEALRFNTSNFLQPVFYDEFVIRAPLYHPYTVLVLFIGTWWW